MAVMSAIALGVAAVGAVAGAKQAKKATKAGKRANEAQRKANQLKNKQAKRQFLRNFRQAQASTIISSVMAGVGLESSAFQGTLASEKSQARLAVREFAEADKLGAEFTQAQNQQASAAGRAQTFGAISSFASSFVGGFGQPKGP
jgi:predicted DsbA family dithiol-disulfide isomerase